MAHPTVRIISSALKGVPFHLHAIRRVAESKGAERFDVTLGIVDLSILRPRERTLMRSAVTLMIEEEAKVTRMHGVVTAVSQVEYAYGGASLRLSVTVFVISVTTDSDVIDHTDE